MRRTEPASSSLDQGDLAAGRALAPDLHDLLGWLQATGWAPAGDRTRRIPPVIAGFLPRRAA
ncbi:hypothetical protein [Modestobacter sp. VKM Ac-2984]|uniref:hypothetical protein n=1 Tax=Modestobacter sp. VKM Ac-2984 TaxID=3004138 RepID=UPI0022AA7083|nr:hypothetical protein [Modestobacter sp. VKM Ac-2984]MCZ2818616.1 hypothetical protein [Modestobacter sp. VKM Ac-2984]